MPINVFFQQGDLTKKHDEKPRTDWIRTINETGDKKRRNDTQWLFLGEKISLVQSKSLVGDEELSCTSRKLGRQAPKRKDASSGDTGRLALGLSKSRAGKVLWEL